MKYIKKILIISFIFLLILGAFGGTMYFVVQPEIELVGDSKITILLGNEYIENGAKVKLLNRESNNNYRITGNVDVNKIGEYTLTYETNISYIKAKKNTTRTITVIDQNIPNISLNGKDVSIYVGSKYVEPGYTAYDNYDGEITDKVKIIGKVDTSKAGEYSLSYEVVDSSNNKCVVTRKVIVKEKPTTTTTTKKITNSSDTGTPSAKPGTGTGLPILMYHYFYDAEEGETGENSNWMEIHAFENQLKYLTENDYYFPSWDEVYDFVNGKITLPKKSIVITVDDGQWTFFDLAVPVINKYDVKVTSFIITSKAGGEKFKNYKSDHIQYQSHTHKMHQGGCSGGHGGLFRCINYDDGLKDLQTSISILGKNDVIAYPYGDVTNNVLKITKAANFKMGVTTKYGKAKKGMDPLQLPRVRMSRGVSLAGFKNQIS